MQKFTKVTQSRKRSIAWENWSYRASWRGGHVPKFAMRQQRKDVSPKCKEAQRELRCYFSGVSHRRIDRALYFSSYRSTLHNFSHIMKRMELISLQRSEGKVQNWVRRRSYYLNLCEAHGLSEHLKLSAKEVISTKLVTIPKNRRWTIKIYWRRPGSENSNLDKVPSKFEEKIKRDFLG